MAEVAIVPAPVPAPDCYVVVCTTHGVLPYIWVGSMYASLNALGHAAAHHRADPPP